MFIVKPRSAQSSRPTPHEHDPTRRRTPFVPLLIAVSLLTPALAHASTSIEVWTRKAGQHSATRKPAKLDRRFVNLQSHPDVVERRMNDPQYKEERKYRGVPFKSLVKGAPANTNMALLHFNNGMVVPVSLRAGVIDKLNAFVAVAWDPDDDRPWTTTFEDHHREEAVPIDPRPLKFKGNKLVVPEAWHPYLQDAGDEGFTPWTHVDSLKGIEFVSADAYFQQFVPKKGDDQVKHGLKVFLKSCQYCHSARDVGSTYGMDFLVPFGLHTLKKPKDLHDHVTISKMSAIQAGLMMPQQKHLELSDLEAVLKWVEAASKQRRLNPYKPDKKTK
jgi:mono/diheme cytochrome c family protein